MTRSAVKPRSTAALLLVLTLGLGGCAGAFREAAPPPPPPEPLAPSPRIITGRVVAVALARGFAFVERAADAPPAALAEGGELIVRDPPSLRETGRLKASRYVRGRTLGATISAGQPAVGHEVIWTAP